MKIEIIVVSFICMFCSENIQSQDFLSIYCRDADSKKPIGEYSYSITYNHTYIIDTLKKTNREDLERLEIGESFTHFYSIYADKTDSIYLESRSSKATGVPMPNSWLKGGKKSIYNDYYLNYPKQGELLVRSFIIKFDYEYVEPLNDFEWIIMSDSTKNILGFDCVMAETEFRGRKYKAYFTTTLPFPYGPWKFRNLPGLIMEIYDTKGWFSWVAVGISDKKGIIYIHDQQEGKMKSSSSENYTNEIKHVTRQQLSMLEKKKWDDPMGLLMQHGISFGGKVDKAGNLQPISESDRNRFRKPYIPPIELE